jgi:hypothetical protein
VGERGGFAPSLKISSLLWRGIKKKSQREAKPLLKIPSPSPFKGEGDIGGEVQLNLGIRLKYRTGTD